MSAGRQVGGYGHELTTLALIGLIALVAFSGVLRLAGTVAAGLTGSAAPTAGTAA